MARSPTLSPTTSRSNRGRTASVERESVVCFASLPYGDGLLRLRYGPVPIPQIAPGIIERRIVLDRKLGGELLVEIDAQAWLVIDPVIAVLQCRAAGENVLLGLREFAGLLNAEVGHSQVEMHVGRMADGRNVAGTMPRRPHGEQLAHRGHLAGRRQSADLRKVNANEINQPPRDEIHPLMPAVE